MNKTRREWSSTFKCCKDKRDSLTAFYSTASAVFIIFISFYGAVYYFGSKYPSTETLDAREILRHRNASDEITTATTPGPSSNLSSTSSRPKKPKKTDKQLIINEEDSSDDEQMLIGNIPPQNTNLILLDN